jgi:hypothetical protein
MSRFPAIIAAVVLGAGTAFAQSAPAPAPTTHAGTRLNFPPSLGGATYEQGQAQGTMASYMYAANKMQIYVSIFDGGRRVPPGSDSPQLMTQFTSEVDQTTEKLKGAGYKQVERPAVPSSCAYGSVTFRCLAFSVNSSSGRMYSKLLLTGYHEYFLKIRIDWAQAAGQTQEDADKALQSFVSALIH